MSFSFTFLSLVMKPTVEITSPVVWVILAEKSDRAVVVIWEIDGWKDWSKKTEPGKGTKKRKGRANSV